MNKRVKHIFLASLTLMLLNACSTASQKITEEDLNQQAGISAAQADSGVDITLPETTLFDFGKSDIKPASNIALNRAVVLIKRSHQKIT